MNAKLRQGKLDQVGRPCVPRTAWKVVPHHACIDRIRSFVHVTAPANPESHGEMRMSNRHAVIFSGRYASDSSVEHVEAIADAFPEWTFTIVQEFPRRSWQGLVRARLRRLRQNPLSTIVETVLGLAARIGGRSRPRTRSMHPHSLDQIQRKNVHYRSFPSLHSAAARQLVQDLRPGLALP